LGLQPVDNDVRIVGYLQTDVAKATQPGRRQEHRGHLPGRDQIQPRADVAANRHDLHLDASPACPIQHLQRPARRSSTDPGSVLEVVEPASDQDIAAVLSLGDSDDLKIIRLQRWQVLERMHGEVNRTVPQCPADGAGEDTGATDLGQLPGIHVTGGGDADEGRRHAVPGQLHRDLINLGPGQGRLTGADPQFGGHGSAGPPHGSMDIVIAARRST
jgi:hypothetical protein